MLSSVLRWTAVVSIAFAFLLCGCGGSTSGSTNPGSPTYSASLSATSLSFSPTVGFAASAQTVTLTNTGTGVLSLSSVALSGANAALFSETTTCGASLAVGGSCTASVGFKTAGSGNFSASLTFTNNASPTTQTVALTGAGAATASASATADCSVGTGVCTDTFSGGPTPGSLGTDPVATGGFHGYADPSLRKDPNSSYAYIAYSWAKTLTDGTHVVDLHLASTSDSGKTFTEVGTLYKSVQTTQTQTNAYSSVDDSSTETVDLLPIALTGASAGQTLWVQAHQSYLVAPQTYIYEQLNATNLISVTAVQLATPSSGDSGTDLLALSAATTGEGRLGAAGTSPVRDVTQTLTSLSSSTAKCANWGQPALWYQSNTLYLALECTEFTGGGQVDANELAHFLYSTTISGTDASKWTWAYVGEFLTGADAAKLGALSSEGVSYQFFTEPEFALTDAGNLAIIATPSIFSPAGSQQPVIQYGCRVIPVTIDSSGIAVDIDATTGAPVFTAKITENDLYTSPNEGPAACTYDSALDNGVVMGRKYENDPTLGFYIYPVNSGIKP